MDKNETIEIMNLKHFRPEKPYDVRVDRTSALGNPYPMKNETDRDKVCDQYQAMFDRQSKRNDLNLQKLINKYKRYGQLRLFCWCSPKRCHVETIRKYIYTKVK